MKKSDPVKLFQQHQSVWQSFSTPRLSASSKDAHRLRQSIQAQHRQRPHTAMKTNAGSNNRNMTKNNTLSRTTTTTTSNTSSSRKKKKKNDPVKMYASHQKRWKKKTLKNIGNNRHDKTRLEIRAKMLRTRLLNVDAGKRGFGRPSRSVDKWA